MVQINMSIPESCASCPLSVRHFGKLYCPPLNDRVGNEGKDDRCPLVDASENACEIERKSNDMIYKQNAIDIVTFECGKWKGLAKEIAKQINALPSAQAEIIRCKDCKNWETSWQNDYAPNYHYCPLVDGTRRDDFYCADAERRTDEA